MNSIIYQLCRPWSYLQIVHQSKYIYDYVIPSLLTFSVAIPISYFYFQNQVDIFSREGLLEDIASFISTLPGFFIAALAAIATFQKNDIDEEMPSPTKLNSHLKDGSEVLLQLTRRRFLCTLFSFLTAQSLLICTCTYLGLNLSPAIAALIGSALTVKIVGVAIIHLFFFVFWQLLSSTSLGLYYLGDRLHLPN